MTDMQAASPDTHMSVAPIFDKHRLYEDALATLIGTSFIALGITFYAHANLMTGSTAGLALLIQYATSVNFGLLYFLINLPFYYFAWARMGAAFAIRTFIAVLLLSLFGRLIPVWLDLSSVNVYFSALMGGTLMGMGVLSLFRHRSGVGGANILALYLQDNYNIRAGYFQLALDAVIMLLALAFIPWENMLTSLLGIIAMNLIVALNHKPGRYLGVS